MHRAAADKHEHGAASAAGVSALASADKRKRVATALPERGLVVKHAHCGGVAHSAWRWTVHTCAHAGSLNCNIDALSQLAQQRQAPYQTRAWTHTTAAHTHAPMARVSLAHSSLRTLFFGSRLPQPRIRSAYHQAWRGLGQLSAWPGMFACFPIKTPLVHSLSSAINPASFPPVLLSRFQSLLRLPDQYSPVLST
jgi:hypothetical protein